MLHGKSLKQKKRTSPSNFTYSIQIRDQIPASTDSFEFLNQINPKKLFPIQKEKKETNKQTNKQNHHPILHIQISVSSKFQLQQTILIFWKKFSKKDTSGLNRKKTTSPVNSSYSN